MGLECLQVARISGAGLIITVDVRDESCEISRKWAPTTRLNARSCDVVDTIRTTNPRQRRGHRVRMRGCGSPKQGLAGTASLHQAIDSVRSGGKLIGVSWFGAPLEMNIDLLRERESALSVSRHQHPCTSGTHGAAGRQRKNSTRVTITHVLKGLESVPQAFEITANKGKYQAINPAQVVLSSSQQH